MGSILIHAALVGLGVVLAVLLERVGALLPVPRVAGGRAELLHLVPRRHALAAHRVVRARLLRLLDALGHLVGEVRRRGRRAGRHGHQPAVRANWPGDERHGVRAELRRGRGLLEASWSRESGYGSHGGDHAGHGVMIGRSWSGDGVKQEGFWLGWAGVLFMMPLILSLPRQFCGDRSATADFHSRSSFSLLSFLYFHLGWLLEDDCGYRLQVLLVVEKPIKDMLFFSSR
jgi:hypothetical protein